MDLGLNGKVAAAIGGSVGIGLAIAELLTSSDADYVVAQTLNVEGGNWMS
jgi:NAD(P)-dependent dehydrogenase (short-subunit alcohol dehydrogenase family)